MSVVPLVLTLLSKFGGTGKIKYFYVVSVYGYSFAIFIPATILYPIPIPSFKWFVLLSAAAISLLFLVKELYEIIKENLDDYKMKIAAGIMGVGHLIFIFLMRLSLLH